MLIRYRTSEDGKTVAKALVYTEDEHRIDKSRIDPDAVRIVERLRENGHEAYIVGGAVRDLLLGRRPKDFDIVTDAQPPRIKRIFRNARVIGRRFRLVHVYAGPKIFEVSTFRSIANGTVGNEYGSIDEDALRRDFSCNALYYDPLESRLVDYVGGFKHVASRRIVPVIPLKSIFREDPVRMIRCVKYAATTGFSIPFLTRWAMRRDAELLSDASPSRLTEEFLKILASGKSSDILQGLESYKLLTHLLPSVSELLNADRAYRDALREELAELDAYASDPSKEKRLSLLLAHFLKPFLETRAGLVGDSSESYQNAVHEARILLSPLNPPRVELEAAVLVAFKKRGISPLQRPRRSGPLRGKESEKTRIAKEGAGAGGSRAGKARAPKGPSLEPQEQGGKFPDQDPEALQSQGPGETPGAVPKKRRRKRKPPQGRDQALPADEGASAQTGASESEAAQSSLSFTSGAARRRRRRARRTGEGGAEPQDPAEA